MSLSEPYKSEQRSASTRLNATVTDAIENGSIDDALSSLMELCAAETNDAQASTDEVFAMLVQSLSDAHKTIRRQDSELESLKSHSKAMEEAQADALVHSAEIIDELEQTKQSLSEANTAVESAARDAQRLADTIFERNNDGVLVLDGSDCVACNDNLVEMLDGDRETVMQQWLNYFGDATDDEGRDLRELLAVQRSSDDPQLVQVAETQLQRTGAESSWLELTISSFAMKDSKHVLLVAHDVTHQKQFEAQLRRHRDFLDNIINAIPDQLAVCETDRTLVLANAAFCEATGNEHEDLIGSDVSRIHGGAMFCNDIAQRSEDPELHATTEYRFLDASGKERIGSVKRSRFADHESGTKYVVSTSRDITEDRKREARLQLLATVFQSASQGIAILAADGTLLEANAALMRMVHDRCDIIGLKLDQIFPSATCEFESAVSVVSAGLPWSEKVNLYEGEGVCSHWVSLSQSPSDDEAGAHVIALFSDITELELSQAQLKRQAHFDALTGLANRSSFRKHLGSLLEANNRRIFVSFLDLDDFKHVNDTAGHQVGDQLLQLVARRIERVLPDGVFAARFGGDEFAFILTEDQCNGEELDGVIKKLLGQFRHPFQIGNTRAHVGLSIGTCQFPRDADDVDSLIRTADIAMYAAKTTGKNQMRYFSTNMQDSVDTRVRVQSKLRDALRDGDLSLHFQPKVDAISRRPVSFEALVRWQQSTGEFVSPSEFIPIAEQSGLIGPLGDLVFRQAAEQTCKWRASGLEASIAVNVSPQQIRDPRFVDRLIETLNETGAQADWFELEITEHAMMDDVDHAIQVTQRLSELGFRIAIDDFGTGYSSLAYLKHFDIDTLKIDVSFVRDIETDAHSRAIVQSIISLGRGLDLAVVAEGVENQHQANILTELGCNQLQGFFTGRPVAAKAVRFGETQPLD